MPRRLNVMHVVDLLALAGMEYGVIKLVNRLDRKLFRPTICCQQYQVENTVPLVDPDVRIFSLNRPEGRSLKLILKLARLLRREKVDIVHSHNWATLIYTVVAAKLARTPVVIHGEHGFETNHGMVDHARFSRWLAMCTTHVTTVSETLCHDLQARWMLPPERISAVPNGVDLDRFGSASNATDLRNELGIGAEDMVVMTIGGLRPVKDHATLIRGFAKANRRLPSSRLVIVGMDWRSLRAEMESLAAQLGIGEKVMFTDVRTDIPALLRTCDVYVNTSLFEGLSNTILEAMASGKPVIATDVGGNPELVQDDMTGFLIRAGDDSQLAGRLETILSDKLLRQRMGASGRRVTEERFSVARMVEDYSNMYLGYFSQTRRGKQSIAKLSDTATDKSREC